MFRGYVDGFKDIAAGYYLGGRAETITKQSLNVELISVKDQVNAGLNLVTFFGHSGPGTIDIDIGYVSDPTLGYNNAGKYPGFLINGCNAGRFFDNRVTFGEDWMLTPNKGAKAFIAHSFYGFTSTLKQYSEIFYSVAFGDSTFLKKGIGEVQKETARRYLAQSGANLSSITQIQQMMLLGDPAVSLFGARAPDYAINTASLSIKSLDGKPVTAQSNSFALEVLVKNFGRAQPGPLEIKVVRTLSDNSTIVYDSIFTSVLYSEALQFVIKRGRNNNEFGVNSFSVTLDPGKTIAELDETNNGASINFLIPLNGTKNLFPAPYSIVNSSTINLLLQSTDLISDTRGFKIEVDTAATFDSPFLKRQVVNGKVLARMPLTLLASDSLVYYWRTKLDKPLAGESAEWATSSFVYIQNGPEGWAQMKFPQLSEDVAVGLVKDPVLKRLNFLETVSFVDVKTFGSANTTPYSNVSLKINQEEFNVATQEQPCRNNTLNLIAFDKSSSAPYVGIDFTSFFDPRACGRAPQMINSFAPGELQTGNGDDLTQWVANITPSDSVVLFSIGDAGYASWSTGVKNQLALLGIGPTQLSGLQPGEPFIIFGRKGAPSGGAKIFRPATAPANAQEVSVSKTITGRYIQGTLASVLVGPAQQWMQLKSQLTSAGAFDKYGVDVTGIDLSGHETLLKTMVNGTTSLSDVNAGTFPYLRITLNTKDEIDLTPIQLRQWLVTYTPMAEGMLTYSGSKQTENLQEGQGWKSSYGFTNISSHTFSDSLTVQVDVYSSAQQTNARQTFRIKPPAPKDTTKFTIQTKTRGKAGLNDVTVFVNPRILPEPYYDNNVLALFGHLNISADKTAPVLDVTIDGRHAINGDAVSSNPEIIASVIDKNPFIPKTDTTGINLFLRSPCASASCTYQRINFSRKDVTWKPATATTDFQVIFKPRGLAAGDYALKAEAVDGSGNRSGTLPYEVTFVVSDKTGFTLESVSPNPSSETFYFKLLLTGTAPPTDFQLSVYSSTGQVIRNFGNEVLNVLHVGTNVISIPAADANGNPLPAGIYLFRMSTVIQGAQIAHSGRLVVMR